ncbi:dTDP-4-dehydrorhamnose reductase [Devosia submarina]|uniref:dTDP-4-dehydrorhamnose reductase n=1 Tax=Devosia submarina TaxID=1173082 RepID=UPI000D393CEB|nr:dTDP-4-dehydrorhamnose reductase [Devosia submarina]
MRIVVTGKTGQVATALAERAAEHGVTLITVGRPEFDLVDPQKGLDAIAAAKPDAIVSAAAYTAVDKAESDAKTAEAANAKGPEALAKLAASLAVPIVHLSTDYVFDGAKPTAYVEEDNTNPLGVYGQSKLAGERAVAAATRNHAILRTAWVYSPFGANFLKTMLRVGAEVAELRVVADQIGNPTSALDIADAVLTVTRNLRDWPNDEELRGVFHMTGSGEASWADFAEGIFAVSGSLGGPSATVARITTVEYPTPAKRPANSRLSCDKLNRLHHVTMPDWQSSTHTTIARLLSPRA